jgi:hypothetical protein
MGVVLTALPSADGAHAVAVVKATLRIADWTRTVLVVFSPELIHPGPLYPRFPDLQRLRARGLECPDHAEPEENQSRKSKGVARCGMPEMWRLDFA